MSAGAEQRPGELAPAEHVDVGALLARGTSGVLWSSTTSLQSNVVALAAGDTVDEHVEGELDVLLVVVAGGGRLTHAAGPGSALRAQVDVNAPAVCLLPAGTRRSLRAGPAGLAFVTVHRARAPFMPRRRAGTSADAD